MEKKLLFTALLMLMSICMAQAQTGPADNEIWYEGKDIDFSGQQWWGDADAQVEIFGAELDNIDYNNHVLHFKDDVTKIGDESFPNLKNLTGITLPNSVTTIGEVAFYECTGLTSINIPNSVTTIGQDAFHECTGLTSLTLGNSLTEIKYGAFQNCLLLESVTIPASVTTIGAYAFALSYDDGEHEEVTSLLSTVTFESGSQLKYIGSLAFGGHINLKSIEIPNSVTTIGDYAFFGCTGLTSINIPDAVTSIGRNAFYNTAWWNNKPDEAVYENNCLLGIKGTKPTGVFTITTGTRVIAGGAFYNCTGLTSINIPNSVTSIGSHAFSGCTGLTSINIPNSVTSIGIYAFNLCSKLTSVNIPNSVTTIEGYAFYNCNGLTSITIPNSVTSIGSYAFYNCNGLTSINIPNSVTSIGSYAFNKCTGLTSINIPNSVTKIGSSAFSGCAGLTSVFVKWNSSEKIPSISSSCFPYSNCDLYVPKGTTSLYSAKNYWKTFKRIKEYVTQVTIPASGKASFSSTFDMAIPSGVTAYYASAVEGSNVKMEPIADNIPANTGVVLKGTPSTAYDFIMISSASAIVGNLLVATDGETEVPAGTYVLSGGAFHPLSEAYVIPAGKAYLNYSGSAAKLQVDFGESTSINDVKEADTQVKRNKYLENGRIVILNNNKKYNLAGQRLD